jgi:hypothetical protein
MGITGTPEIKKTHRRKQKNIGVAESLSSISGPTTVAFGTSSSLS